MDGRGGFRNRGRLLQPDDNSDGRRGYENAASDAESEVGRSFAPPMVAPVTKEARSHVFDGVNAERRGACATGVFMTFGSAGRPMRSPWR